MNFWEQEFRPCNLRSQVFNPAAIPDVGPFVELANPVGHVIHSVTVDDDDCELYGAEGIRFTLTHSTIDCCIISPSPAASGSVSANIVLKQLLNYDETGASFTLTVTAYNILNPDTKTISDTFAVSVTDTPANEVPDCPKTVVAYVDETPATAATVVTSVACATGPSYAYSLTNSLFELSGSDIRIKTTGSLDYETTKEYAFTVAAVVTGWYQSN